MSNNTRAFLDMLWLKITIPEEFFKGLEISLFSWISTGNPQKFSLKFISVHITIHRKPVILKNKIAKMMNLLHSQTISASKSCMSIHYIYIYDAVK